MTYNISQIAQHNEDAGGYYFSRETLKFFGQTRRMFWVLTHKGRTFVYAPSYWDGRHMGYSIAEYNPETGDVRTVPELRNVDMSKVETRDQAKATIIRNV